MRVPQHEAPHTSIDPLPSCGTTPASDSLHSNHPARGQDIPVEVGGGQRLHSRLPLGKKDRSGRKVRKDRRECASVIL